MVDRFAVNDLLTAAHFNQMVDAINGGGAKDKRRAEPDIAMWEMSARPEFDTDAGLYYALCYRVHSKKAQDDDEWLSKNADYYPDQGGSEAKKTRVYFSICHRYDSGVASPPDYPLDFPPVRYNDDQGATGRGFGRLWAIFNRDTGRWEYLGQPNTIIRAKLDGDLSAGFGDDAIGTNQSGAHTYSQSDGAYPSADTDQIIEPIYDTIGDSALAADDYCLIYLGADYAAWEPITRKIACSSMRAAFVDFDDLDTNEPIVMDAVEIDHSNTFDASGVTNGINLRVPGWYKIDMAANCLPATQTGFADLDVEINVPSVPHNTPYTGLCDKILQQSLTIECYDGDNDAIYFSGTMSAMRLCDFNQGGAIGWHEVLDFRVAPSGNFPVKIRFRVDNVLSSDNTVPLQLENFTCTVTRTR